MFLSATQKQGTTHSPCHLRSVFKNSVVINVLRTWALVRLFESKRTCLTLRHLLAVAYTAMAVAFQLMRQRSV